MAYLPSDTTIGRFREQLAGTPELDVLNDAVTVVNRWVADGAEGRVGNETPITEFVDNAGRGIRARQWPDWNFGLVTSFHSLLEEHFGDEVGNRLMGRAGGERQRSSGVGDKPSDEMLVAVNTKPPTSHSLLAFADARAREVKGIRGFAVDHIALVFAEPGARGTLRAPYSPDEIRRVVLDAPTLTTELMAYERASRTGAPAERGNGPGVVASVLAEMRMYADVRKNPDRSLDLLDTRVRHPRLTGDQVALPDVSGFVARIYARGALEPPELFDVVKTQIESLTERGLGAEDGLTDVIDFLDEQVSAAGTLPLEYGVIAEVLGTMALQWPEQFPAAFQNGELRRSLAAAMNPEGSFARFVLTKVNGRDGLTDTALHFKNLGKVADLD